MVHVVGCVKDHVQIHVNGMHGVCAHQVGVYLEKQKMNLVVHARPEPEYVLINANGKLGVRVVQPHVNQEKLRHAIAVFVAYRPERALLLAVGVNGVPVKVRANVRLAMK